MVYNKMHRHKSKGLWQSLMLVFLFALAAFIIFKSPLFEVERIDVRGNRQVNTERIIAASGLHTGVNIFKVNLKKAQLNLSILPIFQDVLLKRGFPDRIIIEVKERTPVALLPDNDGFMKVDGEKIFIQQSQKVSKELPVITGIDITASGPGKAVSGKGIDAALQVVQELPQELIGILSEVHYQDNGSFVLYTVEGDQCRLGIPVEVKSKGNMFLQVLHELEGTHQRIEYVDLSFTGSPVVKYKSESD